MTCQLCHADPQPKGFTSTRTCAFIGEFSDNWNCATLELIRELTYEGQPSIAGIDYAFCNDQKYATVNISEIKNEEDNHFGLALWVSWYKSRGTTEAMWILSASNAPRTPTEKELILISNFYKKTPATR